MTDLASRIRIAAAKGGGLKWLSNEIGVPRRTLGNWLAGRNPKPEALRKVAGATGVNLHWLITGEGDQHTRGARLIVQRSPNRKAAFHVLEGGFFQYSSDFITENVFLGKLGSQFHLQIGDLPLSVVDLRAVC